MQNQEQWTYTGFVQIIIIIIVIIIIIIIIIIIFGCFL